MRIFLLLFILLCAAPPLFAMDAGEALADVKLEARAVELGRNIRCMVCAGESINDSPADLAKDMRALVRKKLAEGAEDEAILNYLHTRYGDVILMKPMVKQETAFLWLGPALFLFFGLLLGWKKLQKRNV